MGLSLGGTSSSSNASQSNTYTAGQSALQDQLMSAFSSMLPGVSGGGLSPNVQAMETGNANQINQSYSALGDRMNRFLAARGFGKSGATGKAAEQTELSRQGALATNAGNAAGTQLNFDQSLLSDALLASFNKIGSTGTTSGSSFGWGADVGGSTGFMAGNTPIGIGG